MFLRKPEPSKETPVELASYDQLLVLKVKIDHEIASRGDAELQALKEKLLLIASAHGVSIADLFDIRPPKEGKKERKKRQSKPKYVNPANPEQTWSGRGRMARWLQEKVDAGMDKEHFAVA